jgi:uncharacterized membrane protein
VNAAAAGTGVLSGLLLSFAVFAVDSECHEQSGFRVGDSVASICISPLVLFWTLVHILSSCCILLYLVLYPALYLVLYLALHISASCLLYLAILCYDTIVFCVF